MTGRQMLTGVWQDDAACDGLGELFHSDTPAEIREAIRICRGCPVLARCAEFTVTHRPEFGVWAGHRYGRGANP